MRTMLLSSLAKVFSDAAPNYSELSEMSVMKNERFSFQLALMPEREAEQDIRVSVKSPFKTCLSVFLVKDTPAKLTCAPDADDYFLDKTKKAYPDLLMPLEDGKAQLCADKWYSLWVTVVPEADYPTGAKKIDITVTAGGKKLTRSFKVEVIDCALPAQTLLHTNWFHNDCLCTRYGVEPFSDKYWPIVRAYIKNAVDHGVNMLLTPIFTPPLDTAVGGERPTVQLIKVKVTGRDSYEFDFTNFEKYIAVCNECGVAAFEISHLFTQWGAVAAPKIVAEVNGKEEKIFGWDTKATGKAYTAFLEALAPGLNAEIEKLGIRERCWFHVSDEPSLTQIFSYRAAAKLLHRLFPNYHTFDALSDLQFFKRGLIETPVPNNIEAAEFAPVVNNLWTYYCCGQQRSYASNRFFAMPSARNRVLGFQLYKYNCKGFLQWGHNFWYTQYSKKVIDPFKVSDAGGAFPAGDAFVVYPGADGTPLNSLRFEVFAAGLCDMRALQLLESLTSRRYALEVLLRDVEGEFTFTSYPHSHIWLESKREEINAEIKAFI